MSTAHQTAIAFASAASMACECRRCKPLTSRRTGTIQRRALDLLGDGRQRTAREIGYLLGEGADTVARELRKLARSERRLCRVTRGGHERAVWFLIGAA